MNKNLLLASLLGLALSDPTLAAPIHSDVALTPASGTTIVRTQLRYDFEAGYQLWPRSTANHLLMGLLELNGSFIDTEGSALYLSPGLEWVARRFILEAGLQIPLVQNLKTTPFETDYTAVTGIRTQF